MTTRTTVTTTSTITPRRSGTEKRNGAPRTRQTNVEQDELLRGRGGPWIVDGGLATALESAGYELHPELWSAGVFLEHPDAVERVHAAFLSAGAEILISASYQMSFEGLARVGLGRAQAEAVLVETVDAARRAVDRRGSRARIAASIGPYGATLFDGSEYRGDYGLDVEQLVEFHRPRFEVLRAAGADFLACETIPSLEEARALLHLLHEAEGTRAWFSFSCRDASHIADGEPLARAAELLGGSAAVLAVGVNCTAPEHVSGLMDQIQSACDKPVVVYPNSGENWNPGAREWSGEEAGDSFAQRAAEWAQQGAWAIGGCCRVSPKTIRQLATARPDWKRRSGSPN